MAHFRELNGARRVLDSLSVTTISIYIENISRQVMATIFQKF